MKDVLDKLKFLTIKNSCSANDNVKRMKRQATHWEKIFAKTHLRKDLSKMYFYYIAHILPE